MEKELPEIQSVAILGAGAMGAYFASRFYQTPGFSTALIASGERRQRLQQEGIVVNGQPYHLAVIDPAAAQKPVDLIIVALKHHQLAKTLSPLAPLVSEQTQFVSVMNGLESEEMIGALYGMEKVLYTISVGIDAQRQGNQITYTKGGNHIFGEATNAAISPRVQRVQRAFDRAGIRHETPPDMMRMLWWKFMVNVGINQASAVTRGPYGVFCSHPEAQALMEALMHEVVALAQASHVNLTDQDVKDWYPVMRQLSPQGKTSMLQDIEAGRKTEVEIFGGKVISLGQALGISTPVNQTIVQIIHTLEIGYS